MENLGVDLTKPTVVWDAVDLACEGEDWLEKSEEIMKISSSSAHDIVDNGFIQPNSWA